MLSAVSQSGRMPGLSLVAWAKIQYTAASTFSLISGSGISGLSGFTSSALTVSFSSAQADTTYCIDAVTNSMQTNPLQIGISGKTTAGFSVNQMGNGVNTNFNIGDVLYIGVYR